MRSLPLRLFVLLALLVGWGLPLRAQDTGGDFLVSSRGTNSVKRYDRTTGAYVGEFVAPGSGGLSFTQEVLYGPDDHLLVTGLNNEHVLKYDGETGAFIAAFTSGYELERPTKMSLGPDGLLYVSQWGDVQKKVARFNAATGAFVDEFTSVDLDRPMDHAWDDAGNLYVVSFGSRDVKRFDADGELIDVFVVDQGRAPGTNLQGPVNLWFDGEGHLVIVDWTDGEVLRYDAETGAFVDRLVTGLARAEGVLRTDELLYVCDWALNRVNRYDIETGKPIDTFIEGGELVQPNSIATMPAASTAGEEQGAASPGFRLGGGVPNPARGHIRFPLTLPRTALVTVEVYDQLGRAVRPAATQRLPSGRHLLRLDVSGLPSGTYVYRVYTGADAQSRAVTVVR
ncbi:MAG: T9SS type A sorting domain-containing protein [Rhodothermales bacterium]|nr:T9SS type A sorting domain-containing protein [Rhodothermales bacterium]